MERTLSNPGEGFGSKANTAPDSSGGVAGRAPDAATVGFFRLPMRLTGYVVGRYH